MNWFSALFHVHEWDNARHTEEYVTLASGDVDYSKKWVRRPCRTCGSVQSRFAIAIGPDRWLPIGPVCVDPLSASPSRLHAPPATGQTRP